MSVLNLLARKEEKLIIHDDIKLTNLMQVVVGSFMAEGRPETKSANQVESFLVPGKFVSGGVSVGPSSPPSHGTLSESSGGPGSPLNQSTGICNNSNSQGMSSLPWR